MTTIYKYKKDNMTINNFGDNKGAMVNYYNNIRNKDYTELVVSGYDADEKGWCVKVKNKKK